MINKLFIKNCGEEIFREHFASVYEEAEREALDKGVFFLHPNYIEAVNRETDAYPRILSLLISEAERIEKNTELKIYALFIHKAMLNREVFLGNLKHFLLPEGYELFAFL